MRMCPALHCIYGHSFQGLLWYKDIAPITESIICRLSSTLMARIKNKPAVVQTKHVCDICSNLLAVGKKLPLQAHVWKVHLSWIASALVPRFLVKDAAKSTDQYDYVKLNLGTLRSRCGAHLHLSLQYYTQSFSICRGNNCKMATRSSGDMNAHCARMCAKHLNHCE